MVTFRNLQKWSFEKNSILSKLSKAQIEKVLDAMKIINCKAGDTILKRGTAANQKILVIIEGSFKKAKSGVMIASKGATWGEEFMLDHNKQKLLDDDVVMETDGVLAEIPNELFQECIGGSLDDVLKNNEKMLQKRQMKADASRKKEADRIRMNDVYFISKLGTGQFGPVYLVKVKQGDQLYALKTFSKQMIVDQGVEKHLV